MDKIIFWIIVIGIIISATIDIIKMLSIIFPYLVVGLVIGLVIYAIFKGFLEASNNRHKAEIRKAREHNRDLDVQSKSYNYKIGRHANETLALRYGIANIKRDGRRTYDSQNIRLKKTKKIGLSKYIVELSDFRNRKACAIIEKGTEYVKTFLPLDDSWFEKNKDLEMVVKGNRTMLLSEIARLHIDKTVGR